MKTRKRGFSIKLFLALLAIVLSLSLTACFSDDEATTTTTTTTTTEATAGSLSLRVSQTTVKSDNSDSATITATVLDTTNAIIEGVTVSFTTTGGQFNSSSSVTTDSSGEAAIEFSAGADRSNQTVTITAAVSGVSPKTVPIQITGSTITLTAGNTNLEVGGTATDTLTVAVKDAGSLPISNADVTASVDTSSTGTATVSPSTGTTDINGKLAVTVTGTGAGSVTVRIQAAGVIATQGYTVSAAGAAFGISAPTTDPYGLSTNTDLTITVNAPTQTNVKFATTLGTFTGTNETGQVISEPVAAGSASAVLNSSQAGVATVQVSDADDANTTDTLTVAVSAPSSEASQIALQASATVVAQSTGDVSNTVTLTAIVKNASDQIVGGAPVAFAIENPTGGGETISPVIVYTDSYGKASSTFTSGSLSSDAQGVTVKATVVGTAIEDTIAIVIGGTAGSIMITQGTTITSINSDTAYKSPMSILVSDSNGNAVHGATVSLSLWPTKYATGYWVEDPESGECSPVITGTYNNEDTNKNLILDPGEDVNGDAQLSPPSSAAGAVPSTVTTDDNGVGNFDMVYLKGSAVWVEVEVKASTLVLGTETQSTYTFWLGWLAGEECSLPNSPYRIIPGEAANISLTATPSSLAADGSSTSTITAVVTDVNGNAVADGEVITFSVTTGTGTLSASTATTSEGVASVTYTASNTAGTETVTAQSANGTSATANITLTAVTVGSVSVRAGSSSLTANGSSQTTITATVLDTGSNYIPDGTTVSFATTAGTLSAASATTTNGTATVTFTSPTNVGSATITATSSGVNGSTTISFIPGAPATVTVTATPANLTADGTSTSTIDVTVLDANSNPVANGETLSFSAQYGTLDNLTATTTGGMAEVSYTAPNFVPASGNDTITVETTGGQSGTALVTLTGLQIASIELSANPTSLPADGSSQSTITATVTVAGGGSAPDGVTVDFSITQGGGSITATATTAGGMALATLTSGTTAETATIRADSGGRTAEIQVEYTPGSVTLTIIPNSLLGTGQGTATVTAALKDAAGNPASNGETVNFVLSDESLGDIASSATTSGGQGKATATFQAAAKGGTVTVTATWTTGGVDVTGSDTITIQPPPAYIEVASGYPTPASINIRGTGGQSTSQVVFDIKDSQGDLVADGYRVDFIILSSPDGGEEIYPLSDITVSGQVGTILRSGYKSGPVSIKATYYYDTNISTTTGQISIVNGPPVGEEFGISAQYLNISGLWKAGLQDQITVSANDIWGNAIPNNTTISFKTYETGGDFEPGSFLTSGGVATSTLLSYAPTPAEGFLSVTAEAVNGGRTTHVTSLAVTPSPNNHIIYAGTDGGGVYKSTDSGATWFNISRSSTNQGQNWIDPYVNDIAVDPDDVNTVYAATGYLGDGNVYRSLDGGMNWNSDNVEEWNGIASANAAMLTVLCDDGGSDYVWIGTKGLGALYAPDGETFQWGGIATAPVLTATAGANGTMSTPILSSTSKTESWTATYVVPSASATVPTAGSTNEGNGTMSNVTTDVSATVTEDWTVTYTGSAGAVTAGGGNTGDGTVVNIVVKAAQSETWTLTCINDSAAGSEVFSVSGSVSGAQPNATVGTAYATSGAIEFLLIPGATNFAAGDTLTFNTTTLWQVLGSVSGAQTNTATTGVAYTSDNGEVSFTISAGALAFAAGDEFTFSTTAAATPYWTVVGTVSGSQISKAYNGISYSSDSNEVTFTITEGGTAFSEDDEFTFTVTESGLGLGKTVRDIVEVPGFNGAAAVLYAATATGVFRSANGGQLWTEPGPFTGDNITTLALHPLSDGTTDIIYAGTEDAGVWVSTDSGASWTNYTGGMGKGLSASTPFADTDNTGNGVMSEVTVGDDAVSEYWAVTCTSAAAGGGTFSVIGTVSLTQANYDITTGAYTIANVLSFTIEPGTTDFAVGDTFTFSTTRDPGRNIQDLLVDDGNDLLYAITYFWGPLEPHAVGNVYVHALNAANGNMAVAAPGAWTEANTDLPQYDPPDDTTLLAQHAMAPNIDGNPTALFIGGEGINLYKATSGLATGAPAWKKSKSGLTNLIMARMPILFSGECTMYVSDDRDGDTVTYTVYIEDVNGNPPISGSTFKAVKTTAIAEVTLREVTYPDTYAYQGTWRDLSDPDTNNPYIISTTVSSGNEIVLTFTPKCSATAPGCSGSEQSITYSY